jgi:hypothetical protein
MSILRKNITLIKQTYEITRLSIWRTPNIYHLLPQAQVTGYLLARFRLSPSFSFANQKIDCYKQIIVSSWIKNRRLFGYKLIIVLLKIDQFLFES